MTKNDSKEKDYPPIKAQQLGVYRVITEVSPPFSLSTPWKQAKTALPTLLRLFKDVYTASPWLFVLFALGHVWSTGIEPVLSLHLSSRVLNLIEAGLRTGNPDKSVIFQAVILRLICTAFTAVVNRERHRLESKLNGKVNLKFQGFILRAKLATDLTGVANNQSTAHLTENRAWPTFQLSIEALSMIVAAVNQLTYISLTILSTEHGFIFVALCLVKPLLDSLSSHNLFDKPHVVEATNPHYVRRSSLLELRKMQYRQDIITGDIVQHILREFRRAVSLLGDADMSEPCQQYGRRDGTLSQIFSRLARDLPMLYYAINAIFRPKGLTLTAMATLHQSESMLYWTFDDLLWNTRTMQERVSRVRELYELQHNVHRTKSGDLPYPPLGRPHEEGMPLELQNLTFSYPGATNNALNNLSLSIKAGQVLVIVGENGSGKSTIVKLLTRLYDATSGSITIDGADIQDYRLADLRHATASLTQDHHIFPLSLRDNIGLGNPAQVENMEMIQAATRQGGAEDVVRKFSDGYEAVLEHPWGVYSRGNTLGKGKTALTEIWERVSKKADVSGGERQRLVASRTFMRFTSGAVKLVCVDEPSSNLDPEAEWQLFQNLRKARAGKTMIFVTHRFAHLTKHADVIVCMKEGSISEMGTHEELMERDGEYCQMFKIQATAFE
ncbi:ABC transporter ATP-binding protein [Favolaschia claudopus]|uniref:ABC transporter ATP-binding protein n=1 Tax=Favolaschia claudopus TaxID=2862362 RepID=A0AAW0CAM3_9AGAR